MLWPMITAHSGCERTPKDSLDSIQKGVALGAEGVEVDVRLDAAGELRLSHDQRDDYTGAAYLADALRLVKEAGVRINCDLKQRAALYPVLQLAEAIGLGSEQLIFSGAVTLALLADDPSIARRSRVFLNVEEIIKLLISPTSADIAALLRAPMAQIRPEFERLLDEQAERIAAFARSVGAAALNLPFRSLTPARVAALRDAGAELSIWTVNEPEDLRHWLRADVQYITTLSVDEAVRLRAQRGPAAH